MAKKISEENSQATEAATGGVLQKMCSYKFCNVHKKTPDLKACKFIKKKAPALMFSCEYCETCERLLAYLKCF